MSSLDIIRLQSLVNHRNISSKTFLNLLHVQINIQRKTFCSEQQVEICIFKTKLLKTDAFFSQNTISFINNTGTKYKTVPVTINICKILTDILKQ